ncbi:MAG TPA: 3-deoxy-D-manno-octulosonic acid transferase, partial [Microscillaceae bacterium]|nr:3-deoxy-D-manno-octulosonic acid transferase [Microscillaceae bacterium]
MLFLYRLGISCYSLLVWIASFFNQKARKFRTGRQHLFQELSAAFQDNTAPVAWFHAASLGEFEQARPVIEVFKAAYPEYKILITFFSPSGYEVSKNYALADFVCYLPLDTPSNAHKFVACVKPNIAFFVKYEFWYYILQTLHQHKIPTLLISAVFRPSQWLFKPYGAWFRKIIQGYTQIFVQNEFSASCLSQVGIQQYQIAGDTRFDRVIAIVQNK